MSTHQFNCSTYIYVAIFITETKSNCLLCKNSLLICCVINVSKLILLIVCFYIHKRREKWNTRNYRPFNTQESKWINFDLPEEGVRSNCDDVRRKLPRRPRGQQSLKSAIGEEEEKKLQQWLTWSSSFFFLGTPGGPCVGGAQLSSSSSSSSFDVGRNSLKVKGEKKKFGGVRVIHSNHPFKNTIFFYIFDSICVSIKTRSRSNWIQHAYFFSSFLFFFYIKVSNVIWMGTGCRGLPAHLNDILHGTVMTIGIKKKGSSRNQNWHHVTHY